MELVHLTPEQEAEAERISDIVLAQAQVEVRRIARLMASKDNRHLLGQTEFEVRNACHRIGAAAVDAALESRKKRGLVDRR